MADAVGFSLLCNVLPRPGPGILLKLSFPAATRRTSTVSDKSRRDSPNFLFREQRASLQRTRGRILA